MRRKKCEKFSIQRIWRSSPPSHFLEKHATAHTQTTARSAQTTPRHTTTAMYTQIVLAQTPHRGPQTHATTPRITPKHADLTITDSGTAAADPNTHHNICPWWAAQNRCPIGGHAAHSTTLDSRSNQERTACPALIHSKPSVPPGASVTLSTCDGGIRKAAGPAMASPRLQPLPAPSVLQPL